MPLVTSRGMLLDAQKKGYAVGAFNMENMEMAQAIVEAAEELKAPVILQTTSGTLKYAAPEIFAGIVRAIAEKATVPVAMHLDHGSGFGVVERALNAGYTSVMIDGSLLPFEENIAVTKCVVEAARPLGIPVEAELGKVGGKEDGHCVELDTNTDPEEAVLFIRETRIDSLAVAIGTAHGFYVGNPVLDKERLATIRSMVDIPLVLHGASGVPSADVRECVKLGICKVNFATELRVAYTEGVKRALQEDPQLYDPKTLGKKAKEYVKELTREKIRMCGADGKAP